MITGMKQSRPGFFARLFGVHPTLPRTTDEAEAEPGFTCATCGRTDLPEAGDWDPPICQECDAAINFDNLLEADAFED